MSAEDPDSQPSIVGRWVLWSPPIIALLARAALLPRVVAPPEMWMGDARNYLEIAQGLTRFSLHPDIWIWPPGYPLMGALLCPPSPGYGLQLVSLLSGVLLSATLVWTGQRIAAPVTGFLAGLLFAVHPDLILNGVQPLSDSPSLALLVAAVIAGGSATRRASIRLSVLAGILGGLAILTRPENVVAILAVGVALAMRHRSFRHTGAALGATVIIVLPYAIAFHEATGAWGLNLKPHVNILRSEAYSRAPTYVERRLLWDAYFDRYVSDDGRLDATALQQAVDPVGWLASDAAWTSWRMNTTHAVSTAPVAQRVLAVIGLVGLFASRGPGRRERWLAVLASAPIVFVPLFVPPTDRFALSALPAIAWGFAGLGERGYHLLRARSRRGSMALVTAIATASVLWGTLVGWKSTESFAWRSREPELKVAASKKDWSRVEQIATDGMKLAPDDPRFPHTLGTMNAIRGDEQRAEDFYRRAVSLGGDSRNLDRLLARRAQRKDAGEADRD